MTKSALSNAIAVDLAIGGSTNAVLHLLAISKELGLDLSLDDFDRLSNKIPCICNVIPNGTHTVVDLYHAGGSQAIMNEIQEFLQLDCLTANGNAIGDNIKGHDSLNRDVISGLSHPFQKTGGLAVLKGNLAPQGSICRPTSCNSASLMHSGPARVFGSDEESLQAIYNHDISRGDVVVIRYEGPIGAPGMREVMLSTDAIVGMGIDGDVPVITDGRFSGFTQGTAIGHITPEAMIGGPIAVVEDGDIIDIDIPGRELNVRLTDNEISRRLNVWTPIQPKLEKGVLTIYSRLAGQACDGATIDTNISRISTSNEFD